MSRARILADYVSSGDELALKAPLASPAFTGSPSITLGSDATGDVYYRAAGGALTRLATGANGTVLTSTGAGAVPAFEAIPAGGITHADSWHITTDYSATSTSYLDGNWASHGGGIGTVMTTPDSSGWFVFPVGGIWLVTYQIFLHVTTNTPRYIETFLHAVQDGGTDTIIAHMNTSIAESTSASYTSTHCSVIMDFTTGSTSKIRLGFDAEHDIVVHGHSVRKMTGIDFIRLGDT